MNTLGLIKANKISSRVLAIDPGYERLGLAVIEKNQNKEKVVFSKCFKTSSSKEHDERLFLIGKEIEDIIKKYKPEFVATEKLFFSVNKKTALLVAEARGTILFVVKNNELPIFEFHPSDIKIAITGSGKADKKSLYYMAKKLIKLPEGKLIDDEVDAICIGLTFFAHSKY